MRTKPWRLYVVHSSTFHMTTEMRPKNRPTIRRKARIAMTRTGKNGGAGVNKRTLRAGFDISIGAESMGRTRERGATRTRSASTLRDVSPRRPFHPVQHTAQPRAVKFVTIVQLINGFR